VPETGARYAHIACCIEDSDASRLALAEARRLRALGPGRLSLVHVAPIPLVYAPGAPGVWTPDPNDIAEVERAWLDGVAADVPGAEPVALDGYPPEAVCDWAAEAGVDLLVAAAHRGLVQRMLLGSFAGYLAHHAPCTILLVRPVTERRPA
jgi:nucleotide-binding universal stress UspA family protein